jgi:hypothetical protein
MMRSFSTQQASAITLMVAIMLLGQAIIAAQPVEHPPLEKVIEALDTEPLGLIFNLGVGRPNVTDGVQAVLAHGPAAIVHLKEALRSKKPVRAAYAAFCLWHLGDMTEKDTAAQELEYYRAMSPSDKRDFVTTTLSWYVGTKATP